MFKRCFRVGVALAFLSQMQVATAALLSGHYLDLSLNGPFPETPWPDYSVTHLTPMAGIEYTDAEASIDLDDTSVTFLFNGNNAFWTMEGLPFPVFNGFQIKDADDTIASFLSVSIGEATNMVGFDASRLSFDANHIWLNLHGLSYNPSTILSVKIEGAVVPVPEPETYAMLLAGLGLMGATARYRRRAATVRTSKPS